MDEQMENYTDRESPYPPHHKRGIISSNYQLICCLNMTWKIFITTIKKNSNSLRYAAYYSLENKNDATDYHKVWSSGRDSVICLYLKIPKNFQRSILQGGFCNMVKFQSLALVCNYISFSSFSWKRYPMVLHWILSDIKSPQVSKTWDFSILGDLKNGLVRMVSNRLLISLFQLLILFTPFSSFPRHL